MSNKLLAQANRSLCLPTPRQPAYPHHPEALRFDSVMLACVNWLTGTWTMKFTDEIKARVKDWAHSTGRRDRDVLLEHLPSS